MTITSEKKYQLLLIDDDEIDRLTFRRFLNKSEINFEIHECAQAQSGIENFQNNHFDCIFLDYQLPDANGLQVLGKVLQADPSAQIVMLTGMGDESLAVESIKAGAYDYIAKDSLSSSILLRCLKALDLKQAKETAEKSDQAKSEFLSKMSHELRTPMNAILGFAQLMNESKNDAIPPVHPKRSQQILIAERHLIALIDEVLELSKIES